MLLHLHTMPDNSWLFDEQGRMRADLPPLLYPDGARRQPQPMPQQQPDLSGLGDMKALDRLGLMIAPDIFGGWKVIPKKWDNPTPGEDWYGLMLRKQF